MNHPLPLNGDALNNHLARLLTKPSAARAYSPAARFAAGLNGLEEDPNQERVISGEAESRPSATLVASEEDDGITGTGFGLTESIEDRGSSQRATDSSQGAGKGRTRPPEDPLLTALSRVLGTPKLHR